MKTCTPIESSHHTHTRRNIKPLAHTYEKLFDIVRFVRGVCICGEHNFHTLASHTRAATHVEHWAGISFVYWTAYGCVFVCVLCMHVFRVNKEAFHNFLLYRFSTQRENCSWPLLLPLTTRNIVHCCVALNLPLSGCVCEFPRQFHSIRLFKWISFVFLWKLCGVNKFRFFLH